MPETQSERDTETTAASGGRASSSKTEYKSDSHFSGRVSGSYSANSKESTWAHSGSSDVAHSGSSGVTESVLAPTQPSEIISWEPATQNVDQCTPDNPTGEPIQEPPVVKADNGIHGSEFTTPEQLQLQVAQIIALPVQAVAAAYAYNLVSSLSIEVTLLKTIYDNYTEMQSVTDVTKPSNPSYHR